MYFETVARILDREKIYAIYADIAIDENIEKSTSTCIYVGKADKTSIAERLTSHFQSSKYDTPPRGELPKFMRQHNIQREDFETWRVLAMSIEECINYINISSKDCSLASGCHKIHNLDHAELEIRYYLQPLLNPLSDNEQNTLFDIRQSL